MSVWVVTYKQPGKWGLDGYLLVFAKTSIGARKAARTHAYEYHIKAEEFTAWLVHPDDLAGRAFGDDLCSLWAAVKAKADEAAS